MLSAWRETKISGHCLKPVFFFPINDENWLAETHPYLRLLLNFFNGHLMCIELQFLKEKGEKKLSRFLFPCIIIYGRNIDVNNHPLIMLGFFLGLQSFFWLKKEKEKCFQGEEHAKSMTKLITVQVWLNVSWELRWQI